MTESNDAYGESILAYLEGRDSYEIIERNDGFFAISGGAENYFADYKYWPGPEKKAIKLAKGKILDVGCGAGRVGLYFQNRGHKVTAIDISPLAIRVCKKRGLKGAKALSFYNINTFRDREFNTVVMFGNNFGLFGSPARAKKLLRTLDRITSDDAVILAESIDPYQTDNPAHRSYQKWNRSKGRLPGQLRIRVRFERCVGQWFDYLIVSQDEMEKIVFDSPWKIKKFIDSKGPLYVAVMVKRSG